MAPSLGGAIARLDVGGKPALRPWGGDPHEPFTLACNVLVPFSNRIADNGFTWGETRYAVAPNVAAEPVPIHGDGFQRPWAVVAQSAYSVALELRDGAIGPWRYTARQEIRLTGTKLVIDLTVTSTKDGPPLPFGCGLHPWFPRSANTRLAFRAAKVWMADAMHLPTEHLCVAEVPKWDFTTKRALPVGLIDNGYTGWTGTAYIKQGPDAVSLEISASDLLSIAHVYSPGVAADFFCFEPVSHPVDAFHLDGSPGLIELACGQSMRSRVTLAWSGA